MKKFVLIHIFKVSVHFVRAILYVEGVFMCLSNFIYVFELKYTYKKSGLGGFSQTG